jgi:hypothetical protein
MTSIDSYLLSKGYYPDSSGNYDQYLRNLEEAAGIEKAKNYLNWYKRKISSGQFSEYAVWRYVGNDLPMMKAIISSQIRLSMLCLEAFIEILGQQLKDTDLNILELGGSDGWAAAYLKEYYKLKGDVVVVDRNPFWGKAEDYIDHVSCDYSEYQNANKFDLIFSILGAPLSECDALLSCISRHASENAIILLAIRIGNQLDLGQFYELALKHSLYIDLGSLKKTEPFGEFEEQTIPVFQLRRKGEASPSHKLRLQRKFSYKISRAKRVVDSEAQFLYEVIKEGMLVHESSKIYDNGKATIHVFNFNGIDFMVWINPTNDIVIDYPVLREEYMNGIEYMDESFTTDEQWYFPKI